MRTPQPQAFLNAARDLVAGDIHLRWFSMISTPTASRA